MLTWSQVLGFGLTAFVVIVVPGPSVVFVIGRALAHGRAVALASVVGNTLGLAVVLALVVAGLGYIVQASATAYVVLKLAGAGYLFWLGWQAWRHRRELDLSPSGEQGATVATGAALRQGFVVGVSNPKAFVIFAAILPPFIDPASGHATVQFVALGLIALLLGFISDSVWAVAAARARGWFATSRRRSEAMGAAGGASMMGLGVALAVSGHR